MKDIAQIHKQLNRMKGGYRVAMFLAGVLIGASLLTWGCVLFGIADVLLKFDNAWCWTAFCALLFLTLGLTAVLVRGLTRTLSPANMAARVESHHPELANRLINVVQFEQSGDREFAQHLLQEQDLHLTGIRGWRLFPVRFIKVPAIAAGAALGIAAILMLINSAAFTTSFKRLLMPMAGIPPHSLTRIVSLEPGNTSVEKGSSLSVTVEFSGAVPETAELELRSPGTRPRFLEMLPTEKTHGFLVHTPQLFEDSRYRISGGDVQSDWLQIKVQPLPALVSWSATVTPPEYTGAASTSISPDSSDAIAMQGAALRISGTATQSLRRVSVMQGGTVVGEGKPGNPDFTVEAGIGSLAPLALELESGIGLRARIPLTILVQADQIPRVTLAQEQRRIEVGRMDTVPVEFVARDEFGVREVRLVHQLSARDQRVLHSAAADSKTFPGRFLLDISTLNVKPGDTVRVRVGALDGHPDAAKRIGYSRVLELSILHPGRQKMAKDDLKKTSLKGILELLHLQQVNLTATNNWQKKVGQGAAFPPEARRTLLTKQSEIRDAATTLMQKSNPVLGDLRAVLAGLIEREMAQAITALDLVVRTPKGELVAKLQDAIDLEVKILAALRMLPKAFQLEQNFQGRADLLTRFQQLADRQRKNLVSTQKAQRERWAKEQVQELGNAEAILADLLVGFKEDARAQTKAQKDDFAEQLTKVLALLNEGQVYEKMLMATEALQMVDTPEAIRSQNEVMATLLKCLAIINQWRVKRAKDTLANAHETLKAIADRLNELEKTQAKISEVARDMMKRKDVDQATKDELSKLEEERGDLKDKLEKLAQDLYQFPELPVANELNSKMREVFEDVEQAEGSEYGAAKEIAVQKEDSLLDAIKNTKERVEDVEMWLPDTPDNVKWDMETFDAAEFPEMPLVPLPDELEDLVGDLLDQAESIEQESQDSTGNNMFADAEMGWDVADGPMPNFSAKGKSGNAKPNDNEMTGRSGAGREGQSNGELVENQVKGLEGRDPAARKTQDPLQAGQVTEAEDSTMDARATGGGKLGGESETTGMFGNAPRRDLHMQGGDKMQQLRQETEALYATSRMLYLGNTANLGAAAGELRNIERVDKNLRDISVTRRVLRRLSDAGAEIQTGAVLNMPVNSRQSSAGTAAVGDVDLEKIDEEYRGVISDYYRNLDE